MEGVFDFGLEGGGPEGDGVFDVDVGEDVDVRCAEEGALALALEQERLIGGRCRRAGPGERSRA